MRRINENDMSRIIKKVLRESESESNKKSDGGVEACFKVARLPMDGRCEPHGYQYDGDEELAVISPGCIAILTTMMVTNPMNYTKIGTLLTCLGSLTVSKIFVNPSNK